MISPAKADIEEGFYNCALTHLGILLTALDEHLSLFP
jgi:hypothetical protein